MSQLLDIHIQIFIHYRWGYVKQIDLIDIHVTVSYYLQRYVSILRAGDYEMPISRLQNRSKFCANYLYMRVWLRKKVYRILKKFNIKLNINLISEYYIISIFYHAFCWSLYFQGIRLSIVLYKILNVWLFSIEYSIFNTV